MLIYECLSYYPVYMKSIIQLIYSLDSSIDINSYRVALEAISEKCAVALIAREPLFSSDPVLYLADKHYFYRLLSHATHVEKWKRNEISSTHFFKGAPHGHIFITLKNHSVIDIDNIVAGRAFDFIQYIYPQKINNASYDFTARHENPYLLDVDHAQEIDRLRSWMQKGHISSYQYDDMNPAYPKAGK